MVPMGDGGNQLGKKRPNGMRFRPLKLLQTISVSGADQSKRLVGIKRVRRYGPGIGLDLFLK